MNPPGPGRDWLCAGGPASDQLAGSRGTGLGPAGRVSGTGLGKPVESGRLAGSRLAGLPSLPLAVVFVFSGALCVCVFGGAPAAERCRGEILSVCIRR